MHHILSTVEATAIKDEKPSKVRARETQPIQKSKVLLERHKTQVDKDGVSPSEFSILISDK